jgi:chromosome segregation ATPase
MDSQNKRAGGAVKPSMPAKRARVADVVDPVAAQKVAPILSALEAADMPAVCKEMFRTALHHCLGTDRHGFKTRMLDMAAVALSRLEEAGRSTLEEAETRSENLRAKVATVSSDFDAAQKLAATKKTECDGKSAEVSTLRAEMEAAKAHLAHEQQAKEELAKINSDLTADQEFFQKVIDGMEQPFSDETITELIGKAKNLDIELALVDALGPALKLPVDQRSAFTQRALDIAVQRFKEHMTRQSERLAVMPKAQEGAGAAVDEATAKLEEVLHAFTAQDKEYDELQNAWAELETNSKKEFSNASAFDAEIQAALDEVEARKADLDATRAVMTSFETLRREIPVWTSSEPVLQNVVSDNMEVQAEAVAAAA